MGSALVLASIVKAMASASAGVLFEGAFFSLMGFCSSLSSTRSGGC